MKTIFLPAGLVVAALMSLAAPGLGILFKAWSLIPVFVVVIFLVNGWQFRLKDCLIDARFMRAFAAAGLISLVVGPLVGVLAAHLFRAGPVMTVGLVVMATVPVTLSSAIVMADICGGNRIWALLMTVGLNICGIFSVPLMLKLCLGGGGEVEISAIRLLLQLIALVLLPFLAGWGLRLRFREAGSHPLLAYVPSTCVILTVYTGFSAARDLILGMSLAEYLPVAGAAFSIHATLLALAWGAGWLLRLARPERYTLLFMASQKTMPVAITVVALVVPWAATALIPCLLFHFIQLFLDSFLASRLAA